MWSSTNKIEQDTHNGVRFPCFHEKVVGSDGVMLDSMLLQVRNGADDVEADSEHCAQVKCRRRRSVHVLAERLVTVRCSEANQPEEQEGRVRNIPSDPHLRLTQLV